MNKRKSRVTTLNRPSKVSSHRMFTTAFDELSHKDFRVGLVMWLGIEVLSFLVLPVLIGGPSPAVLKDMLMPSIIFGVGGAWLMGYASRFIAITHERNLATDSRSILSILAQAVSWVAVAGILYPFIVVVGEFFSGFGR